jgi:2-oxo-4-hydroxy-4-carboxy-5-ureidoimidazoline decarboxylase
MKLTMTDVNAMSHEAFVARFGGVAEHAPWVAEQAAAARPFADRGAMIAAFVSEVTAAGRDRADALLRAHPDLAGKAALAGTLTRASTDEQRGAGLDALTADELARFTSLNAAYRRRFGFPFILAVRGATKTQILEAFEERVERSPEVERATALEQVCRIVGFRIEDAVAA